MAAPTICLFNKFGYCKFREKCRKHHINEICLEKTCEILSCNQRHPKICKFFKNYGRCKFSPCAFKHGIQRPENNCERIDEEIKNLSEKVLALENVIKCKNQDIENLSRKILSIEDKLFEKQKLYIDERLDAFEKQLVEKLERALESYSKFMGEACTTIDDMVVELNDDLGNITIEGEENNLLRTFDNPFQFKCNICDFIAKSERGLKAHKTRKHENCEWCDFICETTNEMEKHKMDQHTLKYSGELLEGLLGKSP